MYFLEGKCSARDELKASLPEGLLELTQVPGLGPKKASTLIEELEIKSLSELEYACRENRLLKLKGFGEKGQAKILEGVLFLRAGQGQQRLGDVLGGAQRLLEESKNGGRVVEMTGPLRRHLEVLSALDFLVEEKKSDSEGVRRKFEETLVESAQKLGLRLPVKCHWSRLENWGYEWARTTATSESWKALGKIPSGEFSSEELFFEKLKLPLIDADLRETGEEVDLARKGTLSKILPRNGVRGIFHNHTTASDGANTLEEMVIAAKKMGYDYIGISDHSQSAFYAQGLKLDNLKEQEKELKKVQDRHPEIRVFWGIESDILADGSLDYDSKILSKFDFVIGSIHSRFQMDRETMTQRILEAIRNPHLDFVGHLTGRLLLGRKGYELDIEKVIREAEKADVAIEINAHPARLDIDWRWGPLLREVGTWVSIHPDAHEVSGLQDTDYGVTVARKALLPTSQIVNAKSVKEVESWLKRK